MSRLRRPAAAHQLSATPSPDLRGRNATPRTSAASSPWNRYVLGDARDLAALLDPDLQFDLTITSPPYWNLKNYAEPNQIGFGQPRQAYLADLSRVFSAVWSRTAADGSLWIIINTIKRNARLELLPFELASVLRDNTQAPWILQDVLIWHKTHTLPWSHHNKLQDHFEYILCFSKSQQFRLRLDAVRNSAGPGKWWVRYPERYHPLGKAPTNVWEFAIPTQGTWGHGWAHQCPLPLSLVEQIVLLASPRDGRVLDPFAGSGTTLLAAHRHARRWIGVDLSPTSRDLFVSRLPHEGSADTGTTSLSAAKLKRFNLHLRQLKYSIQLFKRLVPAARLTGADIPFLILAKGRLGTGRPYWIEGASLTIVTATRLPARRYQDLTLLIAQLQSHPPLSKYQVSVHVTILTTEDALARYADSEFFVYRAGRFWTVTGRASLVELSKTPAEAYPRILSDINVGDNGSSWGEFRD